MFATGRNWPLKLNMAAIIKLLNLCKQLAMAKKDNRQNHLTKQGAKQQVVQLLETSLGDLRTALGEKKFKKRIKQAGRILSDGLPKKDKVAKQKIKKLVIDVPAEEKVEQDGAAFINNPV